MYFPMPFMIPSIWIFPLAKNSCGINFFYFIYFLIVIDPLFINPTSLSAWIKSFSVYNK